jgi:hypothetical protein
MTTIQRRRRAGRGRGGGDCGMVRRRVRDVTGRVCQRSRRSSAIVGGVRGSTNPAPGSDHHGVPALSRAASPVIGLAAVLIASAACGSSARDVANPLAHGTNGGHVVIDRVVCQPTADPCERVVVLSPVGIAQTELIRRTEAYLAGALAWRPTRFPQVVETDEGDAFDGRTSRHGGSVDAAQPQVRFWERTGWAQEVPPDRNEKAVLDATRRHPDAVVVTIL